MRVAFVQGGPDLEAVEAQVERLRRLNPERYLIEEHPTSFARQRMVELFDSLKAGDELCLAALDPLRLDVGDVAQMLLKLVDRGARLLVLDADGAKLDIGKSVQARSLLAALAALHRRRKGLPPPKPVEHGLDLLGEEEIADIRRLSRAGLSLRRIGLIYRRSPKCISEILWSADGAVGEAAVRRRA